MIKQASLSRIAELVHRPKALSLMNGDETRNAVRSARTRRPPRSSPDQIFNLFDQRTRTGLQDFFKGSAAMLHGKGT